MKKLATVISALAISLLLSAITILGAEQCPVKTVEYDKLIQLGSGQQDLC
jgi:hypothetical protein